MHSSRLSTSAWLVDAEEHLQHVRLPGLGKQGGILPVDVWGEHQRFGSSQALVDGDRVGLAVQTLGCARAQGRRVRSCNECTAVISRHRAANGGTRTCWPPLVSVGECTR